MEFYKVQIIHKMICVIWLMCIFFFYFKCFYSFRYFCSAVLKLYRLMSASWLWKLATGWLNSLSSQFPWTIWFQALWLRFHWHGNQWSCWGLNSHQASTLRITNSLLDRWRHPERDMYKVLFIKGKKSLNFGINAFCSHWKWQVVQVTSIFCTASCVWGTLRQVINTVISYCEENIDAKSNLVEFFLWTSCAKHLFTLFYIHLMTFWIGHPSTLYSFVHKKAVS